MRARVSVQKKSDDPRVSAACAKLDKIKAKSNPDSTEEMIAWIREKRKR